MKLHALVPEGAGADYRAALVAADVTPLAALPDTLDGAAVVTGATPRALVHAAREGVVAAGPVDRATFAALRSAGVAGVVIGAQWWLLDVSPLDDTDRTALRALAPSSFDGDHVALPSGVLVGREALLAPFVAKRSRTVGQAAADARADAAAEPQASAAPGATPTAQAWPFATRPVADSIAVVGLGCVLPQAGDVDAFWRNVLAAKDCIIEVPPERWDASVHFDADRQAPDKTYAKIGGFITDFTFDPLVFRIPPKVADALDPVQKMTLVAVQQALADAGWTREAAARERTAVVLGNSMGGEIREVYARRVYAAEFAAAVRAAVPGDAADAALEAYKARLPPITEDAMPGELSNVIAGRIANVFDFGGKNCTVDAACASSLAALETAMQGLARGDFDVAVAGGADRSMDAATYVKFSKIGALSSDGSRPFDAGANGFVMGEGVAVFVLKRLRDAVAAGDRIHAVLRATGSSSDGKGKGITAPNPAGQERAITRALASARLAAARVGLVEAHGTSTAVGDVVEVEVLNKLYAGAATGSVALGSVKSQIGHLKSAAGAVGLLKVVLALREQTLPPSANLSTLNPKIAWSDSPFFVNTQARPWRDATGEPRRAAVSAFGFGGTNFHLIAEEYVPAYHGGTAKTPARQADAAPNVVLVTARDVDRLVEAAAMLPARHAEAVAAALTPRAGEPAAVRLAVAVDQSHYPQRVRDAAALAVDPAKRAALPLKGAFLGAGTRRGKTAFLFPGQGSQYANMLRELVPRHQVVADTLAEADAVLTPLLGHSLTSVLFADPKDAEAMKRAEAALTRTEVTQPAMLAADVALHRLLASWGVEPDVVAGHSLGEYAALVAADVLDFNDALLAVSARGREMASVHVPDLGRMAGVAADPETVQTVLDEIDGYVVAANKNCRTQTVIAGATEAVAAAVQAFQARGVPVVPLNVSAAFHTSIVAPATAPLKRVLQELAFRAPRVPVSTNVTAEYYPNDAAAIIDLLSQQVAAPVEWERQLRRLFDDGVRTFIEVGPKRALTGFVEATFDEASGVTAVVTNHPKKGDVASLDEAAARLRALGYALPGAAPRVASPEVRAASRPATVTPAPAAPPVVPRPAARAAVTSTAPAAPRAPPASSPRQAALASTGFADFLAAVQPALEAEFEKRVAPVTARVAAFEARGFDAGDVVISGAAVGLPGRAHRVFDDANVARLLAGENRIDALTATERAGFLDKHIVRLVKSDGEPTLTPVTHDRDVIKLAGVRGHLDLAADYGLPADFVAGLDRATELAVAAALEALKDAFVPLVRDDVTTTTGRTLPGGFVLPASMRDDTGIIFASAFPGYDNLLEHVAAHVTAAAQTPTDVVDALAGLAETLPDDRLRRRAVAWLERERGAAAGAEPEAFSRKFLFEVLSLAHAQIAELLKARGPNVQVNAACASTTAAVALAEDWIRTGRAKRVIVVGADDATSPRLLPWIGSGFLAAGAATTEAAVADAALPFDKRRHGMIVGMGAVGLVVEARAAADDRGIIPVATVVASDVANSAFHGSRLDVDHIARRVDGVVARAAAAERRDVAALASDTVFVSHETFTPARGGSAAAEVAALRRAFGAAARDVLVVNTKGFTGHPMGAGIEDAAAAKMLQYGRAPPVANLKERDPDLGDLTLSTGVDHDRRYALRLAAGFGSQLALLVLRREARGDARIADAARHEAWLCGVAGHEGAATEVTNRTLRVRPPSGEAVTRVAPPVAVPSPAPPAAVAHAAERPDRAAVLAVVVEKVAALTGYPADLLDPALDMEADLGIDTVKQAELFGALRATWSLPREDGVRIKDHPTLNHVADYIAARIGAAAAAPVVAAPAAPAAPARAPVAAPAPATTLARPQQAAAPSTAAPDHAQALARVTALVAAKTGYPEDLLDPGLDLEADLGIDTVKQAELFGEIRSEFGIPRVEGMQIKDYPTLAKVAGFVTAHAPRAAPPSDAAARAPAAATPVLPHAQGAANASPVTRAAPVAVRVPIEAAASPTMPAVRDAGDLQGALAALGVPHAPHANVVVAAVAAPEAAFAVAKREQDGALASGGTLVFVTTADTVTAAAVGGFARALAREFPDATVRAVACDDATDVAAAVAQELLATDGRAAVTWRAGDRFDTVCIPLEGSRGTGDFPLAAGDVVVATGGATGITRAAVTGLAHAVPGLRFLLIGRSAARADGAELAGLDDDAWRARETQERAAMTERGKRVTPVTLGQAMAPLKRAAEIHATVAALEAARAEATYVAADVADADALATALDEARRAWGAPIAFVVHGAGVEESRRFADKDEAAWQRAWHAKVAGAENLLEATRDDPLRGAVLFGSIAGVFGNAAQADYSAANAALADVARRFLERDVPARVVAWTAWAETGMATRGSTLTVLAEAGVEPLATVDGVAAFLHEVETLATPLPVVVVARGLGAFAATGGALTLPVRFDADADATLRDHAIDGTPVVPGVQGLDAFARAAAHGFPQAAVTAFEDVNFSSALKVPPGGVDAQVELTPTEITAEGALVVAATLATRTRVGVTRVHHAARLILGGPVATPEELELAGAVPWRADAEAVYARYFHGPAYQVIHETAALGPDGSAAIAHLPTATGVSQPLVTEAMFQTAGLWGLALRGAAGLPVSARRIRPAARDADGDGARIVARVASATARGFAFDVAATDPDGRVIAAAWGVELATTNEDAASGFGVAPWPVRVERVRDHDVHVVPVAWATDVLKHAPDAATRLLPAAEWDAPTATKRAERFAAAAAKRSAVAAAAGEPLPLLHVAFGRDADGAPSPVTVRDVAWTTSVSHGAGFAAAAAFRPDVEALGVDVEAVEERAASWAEEAFAPAERARLDGPEAATRAWAAKEAFLKVVRLGLSADLHAVDVTLRGDAADLDVTGSAKEAFVAADLTGLQVTTRVRDGVVLALAAAPRRRERI